MTAADVDLFSPSFFQNPYPTYAKLRDEDPIHRVEDPPMEGGPVGFSTGVSWWITRYDDSKEVLKDFRTFVHDLRLVLTPEEAAALPPTPPLMQALAANLIGVEPPEHTKLRSLVSMAFARKHVQEMADLVQRITDELIEGVRDAGEMELMEDFAYPLPIRVITGMLGLPFEDAPLLRRWTEIKPPSNEAEAAAVMAGLSEAKVYIDEQLAARRKKPTSDLITALMKAEVDGDSLEEIQLFSMIMMLIVAGFETTVNLIGNGVLALFDHPNEMESLREDPELAENAVEEMLRFDPPLEHSLIRWAARDAELRGRKISRGDRVIVVQASANRDPLQFPDPDRFDIRRDKLQHLAFGHGLHFCLGAPLARVEAPIAVKALLRELPKLRMAVPRDEVRYRPNLPFRGLASLPVAWST